MIQETAMYVCMYVKCLFELIQAVIQGKILNNEKL